MTTRADEQVDTLYAPPTVDDIPPPDVRRGGPATFFAVSPTKLVVMSITTLGLYEIFWFYANWQRLRRRSMPRISPFWRTMFVSFTCYSLFKTVRDTACGANVRVGFSPVLMAIGWVITSLLWRLPGAAWLISHAAVLFLLPVQGAMNRVNDALDPGHDRNQRFTGWNIAGATVGGLLMLLAVWGSFLPE
jgi:hypothetical protein